MKKIQWTDIAAFLLLLLPPAYLLLVYNNLPAQLPLHYGLSGAVDTFGDKIAFRNQVILITFVSAGSYLLCRFAPMIDPRKTARVSAVTMRIIALGILLFLVLLQLFILYNALHHAAPEGFITLLTGGLFVFLGNLLYNIKPNYFVGIRTPWTLENETTWRKTHRIGSVLFFTGGIAICLCSVLLPARISNYCLMGIAAIIILVPVIYSYWSYRSLQKTQP